MIKSNIKKLVLIMSIAFIILFIPKYVEAKSYSIEDMNIEATVNANGSVTISQDVIYKFNGQYNGIYITIPYNLKDNEYAEVIKENKINDLIYNGGSVSLNKVSVVKDGKEQNYVESTSTRVKNGISGYYTIEDENGLKKIKVYSKSNNEVKKFNLKYTIDNLCVKHNDVGELYYNFIGGDWEAEIKKLNIDIYLPNNQDEIKIWGHGPYNGNSKIINKTHANFKVSNIKPGQYVATRMMFNNSNILESTKLSNINAKEIILNDENDIAENKEQKKLFTRNIIIFAICLLIYWIILMLIYEKDKKYMVSNIDEDKLFEKYNPMVAGCIQGSRTILARDIIAVILGLIDKDVIKLEITNVIDKKENYIYNISKNALKEGEMDEIERYVYDWVFDKKDIISLSGRLKQLPKEKNANKKFKELNEKVENKLAKNGANQARVPLVVRGFNIFLFILSIILIIKHVMFNGFEIYNSALSLVIITRLIMNCIMLLPLIIGILYVPINLIVIVRHKVSKNVQKITGQKVVTTTVSIIFIFAIIIIITAIFVPSKYIIADEILICIATILILTDNLMLKNSVTMIEDYSKLNTLKYKINNYTIMEDRDIEQVTLWGKYLSYAVSFGVADKIMKRINGLNLDDDLTKIINDNQFLELVTSDYYTFYMFASLDRRFMKSYGRTTGKFLSAMASSSGSSRDGSGGGFSGGGGYSGGGGRGRRPEEHFNRME